MFSAFFIRRPKFAFVMAIVLVLAGSIALKALPINEYPNIAPPQVQVSTTYPGADAETLAESVAIPIEEQVNGVDNMLYMSSQSSQNGHYQLTITFEVGTDPDIAAVQVQNRVALAQPKLPQAVIRQGITTEKQSGNMLMVINVFSPNERYDALFLNNYTARNLEQPLARLPGVGNAQQLSQNDYAMRIWLDPLKLEAYQLSTQDVLSAIRSQNIQASAGTIGGPPFVHDQADAPRPPAFQYTLKADGRLQSVKAFEQILLRANAQGGTVRLKDVAEVGLGSKSYLANARLNNQAAATLAIFQTPGANALEVADAVYAEMERLGQRMPEGLAYDILYDTTESVRASVEEVFKTLLITFTLVVLVTWLFLGDWRATLIPAVAIPIALIGVMSVLFAFGLNLNMITLFALILAIGIVVDDAIIVVENTQRLIDQADARSLDRKQLAIDSMRQMTTPVIATTLVLLAVFVPITFMPGITGELYRQFAITLSFAVVLSSLTALTLSPAMCALLLRPSAQALQSPLSRFSPARPFGKGLESIRGAYVGSIAHLLRFPKTVLGVFILFALSTVWLFQSVPGGFIPPEDRGALMINVQLPDGASLARTEAVTREITDQLRPIEGISDIIGVSGYSLFSGLAANSAFMIAILDDWSDRTRDETQWYRILGRINQSLQAMPQANAFAFPPPAINGLGRSGDMSAQLQDLSGDSVQALAQTLRGLIYQANQRNEIERAKTTFSATTPQYQVSVFRDKAQMLGVSPERIYQTLSTHLGSAYVNDFTLKGRNYQVQVQASADNRDQLDDLKRLKIRSDQGELIPASALLEVVPQVGPSSINRYNLVRTADLQITPATGTSDIEAVALMDQLAHNTLPDGYFIEWTGNTLQALKANELVLMIFALATLFAYLFLVAQYESWSLPIAIIATVVIAFWGALLALKLMPGLTNNLYTQIGMVLLIGIASKNAILMVEFAAKERSGTQGRHARSIADAALSAARLRFRPVMMTSLSFVLGVLPLLFASGAGATSRFYVGLTIIGGMLALVLIALFFIPVFFQIVQQLREAWHRRFQA
ncbi:efflux RND transporter permease subunit [Thiomicrospira sp. WB1]|uniref:efflux RND transporter permease subunit n=1 Tax=Thiomicrospira sp. WB1 TaxID=1685380 RepID=UPI000748EBD0|nr:efflux RND transporter permease subunit [Thiomicrospira sp. WB1]KUJ72343.1 RND transporter [Thiomicrospira sp. WB1]